MRRLALRSHLALLLTVVLSGCATPPAAEPAGNTPRLSPILRRMQQAYPELTAGRFVSLADLETPNQVQMFRIVGPNGRTDNLEQPALSILRSRNETGAGSLKAPLATPDARLLFDGKNSPDLALIRDWRPYALLLMSISGPPEGATLEITVSSGEHSALTWSRRVRIEPGWNLVRLDVDSIGDRIDLADVRAIGWRAPYATTPVNIYIDDIILSDNTHYLFGEQATPGELYAFERGLRTHVGSPNRFELAFADGVIASWRATNTSNLVDPDGLGPWPVPLPAGWTQWRDDPPAVNESRLAADPTAPIATEQTLIEGTPFRVAIEGRRFWGPAPSEGERPGLTARYTIYATGRVYVRTIAQAPAAGWGAPHLGFALRMNAHAGFKSIGIPETDPRRTPAPFALLTESTPPQPDLLWTWPAECVLDRQRTVTDRTGQTLTLTAGDLEATPTVDAVHLLQFWPSDINGAPEAESLAADYQQPARLAPTAGRLITDRPGDLDHDGYNEAEGCYELGLADGILRFEFDPGSHLRFDVLFRVADTPGRKCFVYARGRKLENLGRDANDNLLFGLGRVTSAPALIEVHTTAGEKPR